VDTLVEIHGIDYRAAGLEGLGHPDGYLQRQVDGWSERYAKAATDDIPEIATIIDWLAANVPVESSATLIHNDFKYDNVVFDPEDLSQVRAVLDWEMSTIGDPLADLGCTLAYWIDASDPPEVRALQLGAPAAEGNLTRSEVARRYQELSGRDTSDMLFYYVLALFKVSVIAQQIYARYKRGLTTDERFGGMIHAVRVLSAAGTKALDRGSI
jgi:aminoglycoside phosphotransferase (APT) family kinase protein